jgi:C-terminal processing protease CtpA/Prc
MYAFADYRDSSGRRIEGIGVVPDVTAPPQGSNPDSEIDEPLAKALSWIERELSGSTPTAASHRPETSEIPGPSVH